MTAWIESDGVPEGSAPEWARRGREGAGKLVTAAEGIALFDKSTVIAARWDEVLGVALARDGRRAHVLLPRRPPSPPWIEVEGDMLEAGVSLPDFARGVRERAERAGYREAPAVAPPLPAPELMARVLRRQEIPGAVEVPIAPPRGPALWERIVLAGFAACATLYCATWLALSLGLLMPTFGDAATIVGVVSVFAIALAVPQWWVWRVWGRRRANKASPQRVVLLAPDGCVIGFSTGARALGWDEIDRFMIAASPQRTHALGLHVVTRDGRDGAIDEAWIGAPLDLVVSLADAYRARRTRL